MVAIPTQGTPWRADLTGGRVLVTVVVLAVGVAGTGWYSARGR